VRPARPASAACAGRLSLLNLAGLLALLVGLGLPAKALLADTGSQATILATVDVNPIAVSMALSDEVVEVGDVAHVDVIVRNAGTASVRDVDIRLNLSDGGCVALLGPGSRHVGVVAGERTMTAHWVLRAVVSDPACRNTILMAAVSFLFEDGKDAISESDARLITTLPGHKGGGAW
jgi:hypothetical protein